MLLRCTYRDLSVLLILLCTIYNSSCYIQEGPDPWHIVQASASPTTNPQDENVPPDLKISAKRRTAVSDVSLGNGEWFFKRILGILLRSGQIKENEEGYVDVSLQMKFNLKEWDLLDKYLKSTAFSEDMFRRSVGYIEQAIYKPSFAQQIVTGWSDSIQIYASNYKTEITWTLMVLGAAGAFFWLWNHMSHRHLAMSVALAMYIYEVFTSYKEVEKQELDRFIAAVDSCKWMVWSSSCELPKPDPLIFIKHMNPLKIGVRMFTTIVSEPLITLSDTLKILVHSITDGLWFPLDRIVYGILILTFNVLLLFLLILVVFNYVLNIPFNLNFFGLISVGLKQRNRNVWGNSDRRQSATSPAEISDRVSGATLDRLLDVCSRALSAAQSTNNYIPVPESPTFILKRSASTGRLPDLNKMFENNNKALTHWQQDKRIDKSLGHVRKRHGIRIRKYDGSGDATSS